MVKLLVELIGAFGEPMKQQLTELPVIRFPLSKSPSTDLMNRAKGRPFVLCLCPERTYTYARIQATKRKSNGSRNCSLG